MSSRCIKPLRVGKMSPVKVCILIGTPAILAASILSKPALGVMECTIVGFSLLNKR